MKKMLFALALTISAAGFAAEDIRIDLAANTGLVCNSVSRGLTASPAIWMKEKQDQRLLIRASATPDWKQYSFQITPKGDGTIDLNIMSNQKNRNVCYDKVQVKGAILKNGDFETMNSKGLPEGWILNTEVLSSEGAASGKYCVRANHDRRAMQRIRVKAGQMVEISITALDTFLQFAHFSIPAADQRVPGDIPLPDRRVDFACDLSGLPQRDKDMGQRLDAHFPLVVVQRALVFIIGDLATQSLKQFLVR